jgi:hypothetical protein
MTKLKLLPAALIAAAMLTTPLVLTTPLGARPDSGDAPWLASGLVAF